MSPTNSRPTGPDFLCIGMQKAGTGWLYDQLDTHPSFRMPPIKELHFFDAGLGTKALKKTHGRVQQSLQKLNSWRVARARRPLGGDDLAFLDKANAIRQTRGDIESYAELFEFSAGALTGDITPAYSILPRAVVDTIAARFPELKVILLLREPVSRALSHLGMMVELGQLPESMLQDVKEVARWFGRPNVRARSFPTETWKRWVEAFPPEQIRFFFFEDLCERPEQLRSDVLAFLGAAPGGTAALPAHYNRKAREKVAIPTPVKEMFARELAQEQAACAEVFGGHALSWAGRSPV